MPQDAKPGSPSVPRQNRRRLALPLDQGDAAVVRAALAALVDPATAPAVHRLLRSRSAPPALRNLKAWLEAAPLEGLDLERQRDLPRPIEL